MAFIQFMNIHYRSNFGVSRKIERKQNTTKMLSSKIVYTIDNNEKYLLSTKSAYYVYFNYL